MKYGIHYAYWQHEWKADLAAACRRASALGFDLLEISGGSLLDSGEEELRELRRTADGLGMGVNACHGMSKDCDTGSADPAVRARGIDSHRQQPPGRHTLLLLARPGLHQRRRGTGQDARIQP